ncbi:major facilitator superfamily domain-containing protein [Mycena capillaripes]|nr:major facilitator superfamily domain-containing protein [Mycena capillaripes]
MDYMYQDVQLPPSFDPLLPALFEMTTHIANDIAALADSRGEKFIPHNMPPDSETIAEPRSLPKSRAFYMSFVAIGVTTFLSALDLTVMGTALPTIATALHDTKGDFTWVGSAYTLSSTAFIPLSGNLADAFGRRPLMLVSIAFFALGNALAGAPQNMNMMIAARRRDSIFLVISRGPCTSSQSVLVVFAVYEATVPERPTIPLDIVGNRTSLSGLLTTAVHGITSMSMIYYLPVFFQASLGASPLRAAVDFLAGSLITAPAAFVAGLIITVTKKYRPTWGITIASTILQNMLRKKLPQDFVSLFPPGFEIAYAAIPAIKQLEEPLRTQVQAAFAQSMAVIWQVNVGIAGLGFLLSFLVDEVSMDTTVDESYALKE